MHVTCILSVSFDRPRPPTLLGILPVQVNIVLSLCLYVCGCDCDCDYDCNHDCGCDCDCDCDCDLTSCSITRFVNHCPQIEYVIAA